VECGGIGAERQKLAGSNADGLFPIVSSCTVARHPERGN
jgi:hypothetical protein